MFLSVCVSPLCCVLCVCCLGDLPGCIAPTILWAMERVSTASVVSLSVQGSCAVPLATVIGVQCWLSAHVSLLGAAVDGGP